MPQPRQLSTSRLPIEAGGGRSQRIEAERRGRSNALPPLQQSNELDNNGSSSSASSSNTPAKTEELADISSSKKKKKKGISKLNPF
jgi:hypothetical protein